MVLLQWLFNGMLKMGAAAVPVNMLILGWLELELG